MATKKLIIASNRLPVSVKKVDDKLEFSPSIGGLSTALASYVDSGQAKWIGWPGIALEDITEEEKSEIIVRLKKQNCVPIFLTKAQIDGFYNGYSNGALWPVFHHLPIGKGGDTPEHWEVYREVNQLFADETLKIAGPDDPIWVHDYQLMLLPERLRVARPKGQIGFFLHIPFPKPSEFFKVEDGEKLLRGVLGSDLIGTHTTSYADNFLDCCRKANIGVVGPRKVALSVRVVRVIDFPIGINYKRFADAAKSNEVVRELNKLKRKYRGKKIILTVDRLDPTKGLVERLQAFKTLLEENPDLRTKTVMIMQAMPSRTDVEEYKQLRIKVDELIEDINSTYGTKSWQPVEPIFSPLPFAQYAALYQRANVAFIAPIRDGMNLVAKEYLASHPKSDGVLVLSETAGAAEELKDAILVNPTRPKTLVTGLKKALTAKPKTILDRTIKMQRYLKRHTVDKWADSFIDTLTTPLPKPKKLFTRSLIGDPERALVSDYHQSDNRLLLLDYDGTLAPIASQPEDAKPSRAVLNALERLGSDDKNTVVVISGRDRTDLTDWLDHLPVTLVAEHGAFMKKPEWKTWHTMIEDAGDWKRHIGDLFSYYAEITPGARFEEKSRALVWHYRNASPYHAQKNLVALRRLLKPLAKSYNLKVQEGKKVIEVNHLDTSKGHALQEWLVRDHDFVMTIGDDITDESMFENAPFGAYTIKVGGGQTAANWRLPNPASVMKLLRRL